MDSKTKQEILSRARQWMKQELVPAHRENTLKLKNLSEFNINPFLWTYLAFFLEGNKDYSSLAKVLVYPRVLGASISTSFGQRAQEFITRLFSDNFGSGIPGIDLEFIDRLDGRKKYAQVKAGPNVINRDDVTSIKGHFRALNNLAKTNHLDLKTTDMVFCLLYGEQDEKNGFVQELENDYVVIIGQEFWHRFTGDKDFYRDLIDTFGEVAVEVNMKKEIDEVIIGLSEEIKKEYGEIVT